MVTTVLITLQAASSSAQVHGSTAGEVADFMDEGQPFTAVADMHPAPDSVAECHFAEEKDSVARPRIVAHRAAGSIALAGPVAGVVSTAVAGTVGGAGSRR